MELFVGAAAGGAIALAAFGTGWRAAGRSARRGAAPRPAGPAAPRLAWSAPEGARATARRPDGSWAGPRRAPTIAGGARQDARDAGPASRRVRYFRARLAGVTEKDMDHIRSKGLLAALFLGLAALGACNTVQGVGKDIEAGGEAISETSEEVQESM
jgi:predicted small secreted protein